MRARCFVSSRAFAHEIFGRGYERWDCKPPSRFNIAAWLAHVWDLFLGTNPQPK